MKRRTALFAVATAVPLCGCLGSLSGESRWETGEQVDLSVANRTDAARNVAVTVRPTSGATTETEFAREVALASGRAIHYTQIDAMDVECRIAVSVADERSAEYRFGGDTPGSHRGVGVAIESETIEFDPK